MEGVDSGPDAWLHAVAAGQAGQHVRICRLPCTAHLPQRFKSRYVYSSIRSLLERRERMGRGGLRLPKPFVNSLVLLACFHGTCGSSYTTQARLWWARAGGKPGGRGTPMARGLVLAQAARPLHPLLLCS